jgi:hypothetical protein
MLVVMSDPNRESDRLPTGSENQSIAQWAQHGVEELAERAAAERAELGEPVEEAGDG